MKMVSRNLLVVAIFSFLFITSCDDDDSNNSNNTNNINNVNNTNNINNVNNTNNQNVWDTTITLSMDATDIIVKLSEIDRATWNDADAIRLTRVVEQAVLSLPWNYHYNFIGNDGYNVLTEKLESDFAQLPYYGELESGFLYEFEGGLRIGWDESLGFPGSLGVRGMDAGVIELHEFDSNTFLMTADGTRILIDMTTYDTVDATDYKHPEDGLISMIPMSSIYSSSPFADVEGLVFKMYGNDGFANSDDLLMPYENMSHTYLEPTSKKLIVEESWDQVDGVWRTKNLIIIKGTRE
jgi:hypothetical protein